MDSFNISTVIFDESSLNELFSKLNIERSNTSNIAETYQPIFNHYYTTKDQIVTFEFDHGTRSHKVITYDSAQNLYMSKRRGFLSGPEKEEEARLSCDPFKSGKAPTNEFVNKADEWYTIDVDLAFKCNWLKFRQNKHFADKLLETGRKFIVCPSKAKEQEDWTGKAEEKEVCTGKPEGKKDWPVITSKILMIIREDLRRQAERKN